MTITAPGSMAVLRELRVAREPLRLLLGAPTLPRSTTRTRRVITVPGFGASDGSMAALRAYLRSIGHRTTGWGLGRNTGEVERLRDRFVPAVAAAAHEAGDTVDLVGWSLGGVLAREAARDLPDCVGRVVTYGTPVIGGPRYTRAASAYGDERIADIEELIVERERTPIGVPVTAIYSRRDGVVAWRACIDPYDNDVEHVEVRSSHVGMGLDPDVWRTIAVRLGKDRRA